MEQTISFKIDVPEGKKAVLKDNKIVFEDIKPQLPKTWEEYCNITDNRNPLVPKELYIAELDSHLSPKKDDIKPFFVLIKLKRLRDYYRQGWEPNWSNETRKFYISPWHNKSYSVFISYYVPHFLTFQTEKLAEEFLNNFRELIEEAEDLI